MRTRTPSTGAFLLLWAESVADDPVLGPLFGERDTAFRAALAEHVRQGAADGSIRADADPDAVAVVLVGLLRGIGMQLVSTSGRALDAAGDEVVDAAVALVRQGLGPRG